VLAGIAASYGLKLLAYEAGPGWTVGTTTQLSNFIIAQRLAGMKAVTVGDVAGWAAAGVAGASAAGAAARLALVTA
jgi:hypothetical protein